MRDTLTFATLALTLVMFAAGCDRHSSSVSTKSKVATAPSVTPSDESQQKKIVHCKTSDEFERKTAISAIETTIQIDYESGFDEKTKRSFTYAVNEKIVSNRALGKDGRALELKDPKHELGSSKDLCATFKFLLAGNFGFITQFLGYGAGPYPYEQYWILHIPTFKLVKDVGITDHGFLEQKGPNCLGSSLKGDSGSPGETDRWCASDDGERFHWVSRLMILDDANRQAKIKSGEQRVTEYYFFTCDRSTGVGKTSEKQYVMDLGKSEDVTNPEISAQMDKQCESWAAGIQR